MTWRLARLREGEHHVAYLNGISQNTHHFDTAMQKAKTGTGPTHTLVTQVEIALQKVLYDAARNSIGQKCIRQGATKPWMTVELRRVMDARRAAHRAWKQRPSRANMLK
jgi:hypothetical protein